MESDSLATYRDDLSVSAELLRKCVSLETSLKGLLPEPSPEMSALAISIDTTIIEMNKRYLQSMLSEKSASKTAATADSHAHACQSRIHKAQDGELDLDQILRAYSTDLSRDARDKQHANLDYRAYTRYAGELLQIRCVDAPNPPHRLAQLWLEESKRGQIENDDEIEAVGETEERPFCPISGRLLEEPVRALCGHVFSREHINQVLHTNNKCPSRGCSRQIARNELYRDHLMDVRVKLWQEKQALERQNETLALQAI